MNFLRQQVINVSQVVTGYVGVWAGKRIPLYFVVEFPRSGGKWMAKMLSEYLNLVAPKGNILPVMRKSLVHGHYSHTNIPNVIYIVRDGRDAAVSMAFKDMYRFKRGRQWDKDFIRKRHPSMAFENLTNDSIKSVLPIYLTEWFSRPTGTKTNWPEHVMKWYNMSRGQTLPMIIRYEDMLLNPAKELRKAIQAITKDDPDSDRLREICQNNSFANLTGREPGDSLSHADRRKGIAGDWINYFNEEARKIFAIRANHALLALGYESREDWF